MFRYSGAHILNFHSAPLSNLCCDHRDIYLFVTDFYAPADFGFRGIYRHAEYRIQVL